MSLAAKEELFQCLKSSLDIAVHLSPLALLANMPGARFKMTRNSFIEVTIPHFSLQGADHTKTRQWAKALGPKPDFLIAAEKSMWKAIMSVVLGCSASDVLEWFSADSAASINTMKEQEKDINEYFVNSTIQSTDSPTIVYLLSRAQHYPDSIAKTPASMSVASYHGYGHWHGGPLYGNVHREQPVNVPSIAMSAGIPAHDEQPMDHLSNALGGADDRPVYCGKSVSTLG